MLDVTEQKRAEEALRQSEERLKLVVDAADLGIWDWDIVADKLLWSPRCLALFGIAGETPMTYQRFLDAIHPEDRERVGQAVERALHQRGEYSEEMRTVWPDGSLHWVSSQGRAYYDQLGRPVRMSGAAQDVTHRKLAEEALIRSEKLASVGRMAAAISHEINNPLEAVTNALYLAQKQTEVRPRCVSIWKLPTRNSGESCIQPGSRWASTASRMGRRWSPSWPY